MSTSLLDPRSRRKPRRAAPWESSPDWNKRAIAVGLAATLLLHLLAALFGPKLAHFGAPPALTAEEALRRADQKRQQEFLIQLAPAKPPPPPSYVEVNPAAPVNPPDQANHFSSQDQTAANEKPVAGPKDEPKIDGEREDSNKILKGSIPKVPEETPPPAPPPAAITPPGISLATEQPPEPKVQQPKPVNEDLPEKTNDAGLGRPKEPETPPDAQTDPIERAVPGGIYSPPSRRPMPNRDKPMPRVQIQQDVLPGEVGKRSGGAMRVGLTAVNARFNEFGEYQRRMWEAITLHWYALAAGARDSLSFPSEVTMRFRINQEGEVTYNNVESSTSKSTIGTLIVRDAIDGRSPFGPFTPEMRKALKPEEEFLATFHYVLY